MSKVEELQSLAEKVLLDDEIMYCPHGRPVAFEIKKRELEKQFGRIQ
jgi:DNA mismatch repair protein MutL